MQQRIRSTHIEKLPNTATLKPIEVPQKFLLQITGCISVLYSYWASPARSWTMQHKIMTFPIIFQITAILCSLYFCTGNPVTFQV